MKLDIINLKKQIIYRCSYTGTKETDLLYKKTFLKKLNDCTHSDLYQIIDLFKNLSDLEIFSILSGKNKPPNKYIDLFKKLIND